MVPWEELAFDWAVTGLVTFGAVFLGFWLAERQANRRRTAEHLLKDCVSIIHAHAKRIAQDFDAMELTTVTLQEDDERPLTGFQRRHYHDTPDIFHEPLTADGRIYFERAKSFWPDLTAWDDICAKGQRIYKLFYPVHSGFVHLLDGKPYEANVIPRESPGQLARRLMKSAILDVLSPPEPTIRVRVSHGHPLYDSWPELAPKKKRKPWLVLVAGQEFLAFNEKGQAELVADDVRHEIKRREIEPRIAEMGQLAESINATATSLVELTSSIMVSPLETSVRRKSRRQNSRPEPLSREQPSRSIRLTSFLMAVPSR